MSLLPFIKVYFCRMKVNMNNLFFLSMFEIVIASLVIKWACDTFEQAASFLSKNMNAGARGALIDAIGSSLPELFVTAAFILQGSVESILCGISVTAGSAIFNILVIPMVSIIAAKNRQGESISSFSLSRKVILRDGFFLLLAEAALIYFLGLDKFTITSALCLVVIYVAYAVKVIMDSNAAHEPKEPYEYEKLEYGKWSPALLFDVNRWFGNARYTMPKAIFALSFAVVCIGAACHFLAAGVADFAVAVNIKLYLSGVLLGAAATSLPDTILSVKSAQRGDYEDAVANAVGSNTFDVTVSLAVPILCYLVALLAMGKDPFITLTNCSDLTVLRVFVLGTSVLAIGLFWTMAKKINKWTAAWLGVMYAGWVGFLVYTNI